MDTLTDNEIDQLINRSKLAKKYAKSIDRESAHEILTQRIEAATHAKQVAESEDDTRASRSGTSTKKEKSTLETILDSSVTRQVGRTAANVITRTLLGALGLGGRSTSRKKSGWF
jgi:hypothetical protein